MTSSGLGLVLGPLLFLVFINSLPNDIKSETKLLPDYVKQLIRLFSKEMTQNGSR